MLAAIIFETLFISLLTNSVLKEPASGLDFGKLIVLEPLELGTIVGNEHLGLSLSFRLTLGLGFPTRSGRPAAFVVSLC